ncbi:MAG: Crp/Fnr family transcriptional regulator [Pseudomonadota bacterium]
MEQNPPLLTLLSAAEIRDLVAAGEERRFTDNQNIHARGSDLPGLSVIKSGRVRFGIFGEDGRYIQTGLLGQGHCFGEATLFANMPRAYDADAVGETVILSVSKKKFDDLCDAHPGIAKALLVTLTSRLYEALDFADDIRRLSIETRIAKQLFRFVASGGFSSETIPVRQTDLAYALGLSRVSVGKALETLKRRGLIELGYGEIRIADRAGLENWVIDHDSRHAER